MSDANDLIFGNSVEGAKFNRVGDNVYGKITRIWDKQQCRKWRMDGKPGDLEYWDDEKTEPIWQVRIDMQTETRDPSIQNDTGVRAVYLRASSEKQRATKVAVLASGDNAIREGAMYGLRMIGEEENGTNNPKKLFDAVYTPPAPSGSAAVMGGSLPPMGQQQQAPPVQQQAQQAQQAQQGQQYAQQYNQQAPQYQQGGQVQPQQQMQAPPVQQPQQPVYDQQPGTWDQQAPQQAQMPAQGFPQQAPQGQGFPPVQQPVPAQQQLAQAQQQYGIPNPAPNMQNPPQGVVGMQQPANNPADDPAVQALLNQVANQQQQQQ